MEIVLIKKQISGCIDLIMNSNIKMLILSFIANEAKKLFIIIKILQKNDNQIYFVQFKVLFLSPSLKIWTILIKISTLQVLLKISACYYCFIDFLILNVKLILLKLFKHREKTTIMLFNWLINKTFFNSPNFKVVFIVIFMIKLIAEIIF
jgi:carbon starvation protein CstA